MREDRTFLNDISNIQSGSFIESNPNIIAYMGKTECNTAKYLFEPNNEQIWWNSGDALVFIVFFTYNDEFFGSYTLYDKNYDEKYDIEVINKFISSLKFKISGAKYQDNGNTTNISAETTSVETTAAETATNESISDEYNKLKNDFVNISTLSFYNLDLSQDSTLQLWEDFRFPNGATSTFWYQEYEANLGDTTDKKTIKNIRQNIFNQIIDNLKNANIEVIGYGYQQKSPIDIGWIVYKYNNFYGFIETSTNFVEGSLSVDFAVKHGLNKECIDWVLGIIETG